MKNSHFIIYTGSIIIFVSISSGFLFGSFLTEQFQLNTQYITKHYTIVFEANVTLFPVSVFEPYELMVVGEGTGLKVTKYCFYAENYNGWKTFMKDCKISQTKAIIIRDEFYNKQNIGSVSDK